MVVLKAIMDKHVIIHVPYVWMAIVIEMDNVYTDVL